MDMSDVAADTSLNILRAIDYSAHPAFQPLARPSVDCSAEIDEALHRIDKTVAEFLDSSSLSRGAITKEVDRRIESDFDRITALSLNQLRGRPLATRCFITAIRNARNRVVREAVYKFEMKAYRDARCQSAPAKRALEDLQKQGYSVRRIAEPRIKELYDLLTPHRERLEVEARVNRGVRCDVSLPTRGAYWDRVVAMMEEEGFLDAACDHLRHRVDLAYCALVLSHPGMKWWKSCYEDVGVPTARTATMHFDADFGMMKAIVYLHEVGKGQGPFSLIPGSDRWPRSGAHLAVVFALDAEFIETLGSMLPADSVYWRKLFQPPYREDFVALPKIFQATTGFGDDVLDGSELSDRLLKAEHPLLSTEGNCFLFTGSNVIHRGGCAESANRWVLQLGFMKKPSLVGRASRKVRSLLSRGWRRFAGYPTMR
jgi:hypothetical protein